MREGHEVGHHCATDLSKLITEGSFNFTATWEAVVTTRLKLGLMTIDMNYCLPGISVAQWYKLMRVLGITHSGIVLSVSDAYITVNKT